MPTVFQRQIDTALRLIAKNGKDVVLRRDEPILEPVTQELNYFAAPSTETMKAVRLPITKGILGRLHGEQALKDLQDSKAQSMLIAAKGLTLTPKPSDTFDLGGADGGDWKVYGVDTLAPDGTDILHTVILFK